MNLKRDLDFLLSLNKTEDQGGRPIPRGVGMTDAMRELDRQVAEEVMGWGEFWTDGVLLYGVPPACAIEDDRQEVPRYSTNMSDAWEIFGRVLTYGFARRLMRSVHRPVDEDRLGYQAITDLLWYLTPEVICRSALASVREEEA